MDLNVIFVQIEKKKKKLPVESKIFPMLMPVVILCQDNNVDIFKWPMHNLIK